MPPLTSVYDVAYIDSFVNAPPALHTGRDRRLLPEQDSEVTQPASDVQAEDPTTTTADKAINVITTLFENLYDANNPFPRLLSRVASMKRLGDNWNSYGSAAPNRLARFWARRALHELVRLNYAPSTVSASSDEGVAIFFYSNEKRASIECLNTGEILGVMSKGQEPPEVWPILPDHLTHATSRIKTFMTA
jgi:hypothetical protein